LHFVAPGFSPALHFVAPGFSPLWTGARLGLFLGLFPGIFLCFQQLLGFVPEKKAHPTDIKGGALG
jgi:hypothetical protein